MPSNKQKERKSCIFNSETKKKNSKRKSIHYRLKAHFHIVFYFPQQSPMTLVSKLPCAVPMMHKDGLMGLMMLVS